jgi:hypothetical protein
MEIGAGRAIADSPDCLLSDFVVIIQENLDEFVDNAHVKALLDLRA